MMKYIFFLFFLRRFFLMSVLSMSLLGCAGMNSEFDCPREPGINCKSLGEVNEMVNQGKIGRNYSAMNAQKTGGGCRLGRCNKTVSQYPNTNNDVLRIWVAPYADEEGNYHQSGMLYSALTP